MVPDLNSVIEQSPDRSVDAAPAGWTGGTPREPSRILDILGPDLFAPVRAVQIPGRVIWCNFDLARQSGFPVPASNRMTPRLHDCLVAAFSWKSLRSGEDAAGRQVCTLYADRYGGDGIGSALGSGRGAFVPWCDAFLKGVGFTPLFRQDDPNDFVHSHGGLDMHQALAEAVFGEVDTHLFRRESARILAIIDQDDYTVRPSGRRTPRAIAVRVGNQVRPAHIMARGVRWDRRSQLDVFVAGARESRQLVSQANGVPDVFGTILRILDDHACTAAQQVRWRMTHCFLTPSNMRLDGGMLDLNTQRANPRCTPAATGHQIPSARSRWPDYIDRVNSLRWFYTALRRSLTETQRRDFHALPLRLRPAMDAAYDRHLERELLCAAGLKSRLARRLQEDHAVVARRFTGVLIRMTGLTNPVRIAVARRIVSEAAALDVFHLLAVYPRISGGPREAVNRALRPLYRGDPRAVGAKQAAAEALIEEFVEAYAGMIECCNQHAAEYYGSISAMRRSIAARAAFENAPFEHLFRPTFRPEFQRVAFKYRRTRDAEVIREAVDAGITQSLRKVEALLRQGARERLTDGLWALQIRAINGMRLAVRVSRGSRPGAHIALTLTPELAGSLRLDRRRIRSLRCRYTTDEWATSAVVAARFESRDSGGDEIVFRCLTGVRLAGEWRGYLFEAGSDGIECEAPGGRVEGYAYALPDPIDLAELFAEDADEKMPDEKAPHAIGLDPGGPAMCNQL